MKVGIAIEKWKLPIFSRHLKQAGYSYDDGAGVTADTIMLYVHTLDAEALKKVVIAASTEAARTGAPKT